uniref:Pectate lyase n=1 Tax=Podoviridae sp. ctnWS46 TaxID=2827747 RepID=A0A8S5SZL8_9CAUD|nr:MAG TPA: Pectate lyase [Podoviridae sp. ctnWS46]
MDFDKIKQNILNSSETSTSESESISSSELHEEFEINNFLPEFEPLKLSGKNLAQQYVSAFNTGMNVYQCLNYLQGYVYTLVTAMNETIEAWNTVVPLLEQATKEWTDEEFDYKWSILKPQVIELVTNLTIETFNKSWEELKPVVIKLAQDTTDAEFKKQWDILKPQVITLVEETTTNKFNEEWEKLKPTIIQLSTDTTIAQFNRSWEELKPKVIELSQTTTSNKFDEKWEELRPQVIELAQTTTSNKFDEKWEALQPTLTETVNNLAKTQTTTTFNEKWEELKPQVIDLAQNTTNTKFDEKWTELQPTLTETVTNLVNTNLETFKSTLWQEVTKNESFPFLLVENYGAVGDGETDDSNAFNRCFTDANNSGKYVLLGNGLYLIANKLNDLTDIYVYGLYGVKPAIKLNDNVLTDTALNCYFYNIHFLRDVKSDKSLINNFNNSQFSECNFTNIYELFSSISPKTNMFEHVLLNNCELINSHIISVSRPRYTGIVYIINNTLFYYDGTGSRLTSIISGYVGGKFIFNSCTFSKNYGGNVNELFGLVDDMEFNNCAFNVNDNANIFFIPNISNVLTQKIEFNSCNISKQNNSLVMISLYNKTIFTCVIIKHSFIALNTLFNSQNECSVWLENNRINIKPTINSGAGKVNIVEIQQKDNDASQNIFPWTTEPTPTVENNVSINSAGTGNYYVLTENEDKTIKKLDYYFKYNQVYTKGAPYYNTGQTFNGLDLTGYTVKTFMLKNNIFKLKDSDGNLIDYVYFDLNSASVSGGTAGAIHYTMVNMQFIPAVTKWTGKEEANGNLEVNTCITLILEKTSS